MADKRRSAAQSRQEIGDTALDLFVAHGYGATSLEDIAGRLGLTRQAVLYHFRSKEELLRSVLDPYFSAMAVVLDAMVVSDPPTRVQRQGAVTALVEVFSAHRPAIALLNRFTTESKIADLGPLLTDLNRRITQVFAGSAYATDPALRVRVVGTLAALAGVMAAQGEVPFGSPDERRAMVDGCVAMLEAGT